MTELLAPPTIGADTSARRVDGKVVKGAREGQKPVPGVWVIVHRVGRDRAGPLDSVRTAANGTYSVHYTATGDTTALYFVSTTYGGVIYLTAPLRAQHVFGDEASLTVFDTTSAPIPIRVAGRHFIVGSPGANGRRPIGEVFDLQNDSTVTLVAKDSVTPSWTIHIPADAQAFQLNRGGELANGALTRRGNEVGIFVPLSPGIRQIAFTYELPTSAFPLAVPLERETGIFEILLQEPQGRISGIPFRETQPQAVENRTFRRFLAQDLPANAVMRIEVPRIVGAERERVYIGVSVALIAGMAAALLVTARRAFRPRAAPPKPVVEQRSQELLRSIAALDAEFERVPTPDDSARASYEERRNELKAELMAALAAERRRP